MSTRNLPGVKGRPARKADNITAICEPIVQEMWEPRRLTTLWAFMACYRDSFTFFLFNKTDKIQLFANKSVHSYLSTSDNPRRNKHLEY
jgi:hypothetical protein